MNSCASVTDWRAVMTDIAGAGCAAAAAGTARQQQKAALQTQGQETNRCHGTSTLHCMQACGSPLRLQAADQCTAIEGPAPHQREVVGGAPGGLIQLPLGALRPAPRLRLNGQDPGIPAHTAAAPPDMRIAHLAHRTWCRVSSCSGQPTPRVTGNAPHTCHSTAYGELRGRQLCVAVCSYMHRVFHCPASIAHTLRHVCQRP